MELISVIIPAYNVEKYIEECIMSILHNTYKNIEVIVVDDGSEDNTCKICNKIANRFQNVKLFNANHSGVSSARNLGIQKSSGKYILFVDGDDWISSDYISDLYNHIIDRDLSIAGYSIFYDGEKNNINEFSGVELDGDLVKFLSSIRSFLYPPYLLSPCFKLFRSDIIKEHGIFFPTNLSYGEDAIFSLNYVLQIKQFCAFKNSGYFYRRHGNETLSTKFRREMLDNDIVINNIIANSFQKYGIEDGDDVISQRTIDSFCSYSVKLMNSDIADKKTLFYLDSKKIDINIFKKQRNFRQLGIWLALKNKHFFFVMNVYKIKFFVKNFLRKINRKKFFCWGLL